ncbi:MAG: hypothetical protein QM784_05860 [Polyangiaceae bacterium]
MTPSTIRILGLIFAVAPFACVAMSGGQMDSTSGGAGADRDDTDIASSGGSASQVAATGKAPSPTSDTTAKGGTTTRESSASETGGSTGGAVTTSNNGSDGPHPNLRYGVSHVSPYPCAANTAAYYDATPVPSYEIGCKDIYNSAQLYPPNTSRTIVAPTSPGGASCVAYDCWCSGETELWEPSDSPMCGH